MPTLYYVVKSVYFTNNRASLKLCTGLSNVVKFCIKISTDFDLMTEVEKFTFYLRMNFRLFYPNGEWKFVNEPEL